MRDLTLPGLPRRITRLCFFNGTCNLLFTDTDASRCIFEVEMDLAAIILEIRLSALSTLRYIAVNSRSEA